MVGFYACCMLTGLDFFLSAFIYMSGEVYIIPLFILLLLEL